MKKILTSTLLASTVLFLAFTKPKTETYKVDTEKSSIEWIGRKVTGQHNGVIKLAGGELAVAGNAVKAGTVTIDMNSITVLDLEGNSKEKLTGHLKSDDFFSVEKNPVSKFQITKVSAASADRVNVTGNLTIKGITKSLTFPATVKKQGDVVVAVAKGVKVNRAQYDIRYGSNSFFGDLGNKAIDDEFELSFNLVAKK
jgi:polyisoprenoid-binding protein YceI